jgi:hypothetical protein
MKTFAKLLGFLGGAVLGLLAVAILMEINRLEKGPFPGLAGLIVGSVGWKIVGKAMDKKE